MILYILVRKSYLQISDFYAYCSVIYVIYNHDIINMYVLSYHLSKKLIRQLYKLGNGFGKFKKDSNRMILYIRVRKSYFQISDFYAYCSVIYVTYNHNIINMYVLSYHLSTRMMFIKHYAPNRSLCIKVAKSTMCNWSLG